MSTYICIIVPLLQSWLPTLLEIKFSFPRNKVIDYPMRLLTDIGLYREWA